MIVEPGKEQETILRLARVGYENVLGYLNGGISVWDSPLSTVTSIAAEDLKANMANGVSLLDVRKPGEWATSHLKDASFVPLAEFPEVLDGLDTEKPYVVYCGGGYRSMTAISIMRNHGFKKLINVYGGFGALQKAGLPVVTEAVEA